MADSARPHVVGSQVTHRASRITHPGLLLLVTLAGCGAASDGVIALEGATLIDGSGGEPIKDALVLVQHGHIQAVARVNEIPVPRGARVLNLIGKTIIPGLIDAHAHVERWAAQRYLVWGVTTVRDLGALSTDSAIALKNDFDLGSVLGPRMLTSGAMIDALTAARAGVASLEHMAGVVAAVSRDPARYFRAHDQFLRGWTTEEMGWAALDSAALARTARALAATRVAIVPTLVVHEMLSRLDNPTLLSRPGMEDVPPAAASVRDVAGLLRRTGWRTADLQAFRRSRARQNQFVREFKRAGGLIAAGSDAANQLAVPGLSLHEELSLLVAAGLTPVEALTAATRKGAELLRADSLGRVATGKVADLVVLDANPAANIAATRRIAWVMLRGRIFYPDSLRRTWAK